MNYGFYLPSSESLNGVFMQYKRFINTKCSQASSGSCENILNGKIENIVENYWKSENDTNAFFEVTFKKGLFYPTDGILLSCYIDDCIHNFTIYGIEAGKNNYEEICVYEGGKKDFNRVGNRSRCPSFLRY